MKTKDIKDILKDRPNAIFLAHPTRLARWGDPVVVTVEDNGTIRVRYIKHDGTLSSLRRHEARDIRAVTDTDHQGEAPDTRALRVNAYLKNDTDHQGETQ